MFLQTIPMTGVVIPLTHQSTTYNLLTMIFKQPHPFCFRFYHSSKLQIIVENRIAKWLCTHILLHDLCHTLYLCINPRIHKRTKWFTNRSQTVRKPNARSVNGTANRRRATCERFTYHSPRTKVCRFFAQTQRKLDVPGVLSMHRVSFARLGFVEN